MNINRIFFKLKELDITVSLLMNVKVLVGYYWRLLKQQGLSGNFGYKYFSWKAVCQIPCIG